MATNSISRTGQKGGGLKLIYLDYISTEEIIHISVIRVSYEAVFVKASNPCLGNMYIAGIYRPPNKLVTDLTQCITGAMDYTNRFHTVFAGDFSFDAMNNSNAPRNYISTFHQ